MYALFVYVDHKQILGKQKHIKAHKGILKENYYGNFSRN